LAQNEKIFIACRVGKHQFQQRCEFLHCMLTQMPHHGTLPESAFINRGQPPEIRAQGHIKASRVETGRK
jgi:hypothetical protein